MSQHIISLRARLRLLALALVLASTCTATPDPATDPVPDLVIEATTTPQQQQLQWTQHIPRGLKYFPEDEELVKRGLDAHQKLVNGYAAPVGVRRMSGDPDEMFFLDYWMFGDDEDQQSNGGLLRPAAAGEEAAAGSDVAYGNGTNSWLMAQPMLAHATSRNPGSLVLRALQRRDFACPNGYNSCSGIGRQYSCCASGTSCVSVQDNGLGDVGCCPNGASCGGSAGLGSCDASRGFKSCPGSSNGGCCLPGFDCLGVGCVSVSTSTTTTTLGVSTVRACQSGDQTCPSSLGGGCCASSLTCGSSNSCLGASSTTTTTTAAAVAPVRPTSVSETASSDAAVAPSITSTGTQLIAICPTNYYFCSAYYRPGCCQIGRDCKLTNCPAAASSSTFVSNGVTIVVPIGPTTGGTSYQSTALITGTAAAVSYPARGSCIDGWASCAQSLLGGCCPQGFSCGAICTGDVGAGQTVVAKMRPNAASSSRLGVGTNGLLVTMLGAAFGFVVGMIMTVL